MLLRAAVPAQAGAPANVHFERTWMWGPETFTGALIEPYLDLALEREERVVQYFDKARMEISDPGVEAEDVWHVTNRLLVVELMSGRLRASESRLELHEPARIGIAGDPAPVLCFERRCLAYTLDNAPGWRVESGNVGRHYYEWRYDQPPPEPLRLPAAIGGRS
jgi:hypothetical protein